VPATFEANDRPMHAWEMIAIAGGIWVVVWIVERFAQVSHRR